MKPEQPVPVKLFIGILYSDEELLKQALSVLEAAYGPVDAQSSIFSFTVSDYYVPEMGSPIFRVFCSYEKLISPGDIASIKRATNRIEDDIAGKGCRRVNLDPGYLDYDKVVLASGKYNGNKVYLDYGIWADLTLFYTNGSFTPYPWSFPDFKAGEYTDFFMRIRAMYKKQRRNT